MTIKLFSRTETFTLVRRGFDLASAQLVATAEIAFHATHGRKIIGCEIRMGTNPLAPDAILSHPVA